MNRSPSDNLDNLLLVMSKIEYRDYVGINLKLAKSLIEIMEEMKAMLEYEINVRDIETFMPIKQNPHRSSDGAYM